MFLGCKLVPGYDGDDRDGACRWMRKSPRGMSFAGRVPRCFHVDGAEWRGGLAPRRTARKPRPIIITPCAFKISIAIESYNLQHRTALGHVAVPNTGPTRYTPRACRRESTRRPSAACCMRGPSDKTDIPDDTANASLTDRGASEPTEREAGLLRRANFMRGTRRRGAGGCTGQYRWHHGD